MQPPTPHRIPYTPIQQNPFPLWMYPGPGGGGGGVSAVVFELTEELARGIASSANANVVATTDANTVDVGVSIVVHNTGESLGLVGARGVAVLFKNEWWVVELDQQAILAKFTLRNSTHITSGTFSVAEQNALTIDDFSELSPYPFGDLPEIPEVTNPYNLIGITGDTGLAAYRKTENKYVLLRVYPSRARRFFFELSADWPNGLSQTSTNASLIHPDPINQGGNTNYTTFTLRDRFNKASNAKGSGPTKDTGICQLNYKSGQFDILHITHECRRGRGQVYSGFSDGPETFQVQNVIGFDGRPPATSPLTVHNELEIQSLATGDWVEISWNTIEGRYYALPPSHQARWFILAEDIEGTSDEEVYAWIGKLDTGVAPVIDTNHSDPVLLLNIGYSLSPAGKLAKAGYYGRMEKHGNNWIPISTYRCLSTCTPASGAAMETPAFPNATVGSPYSFTIAITGSVTGITCTNLPPGLSFDSGTLQITGTPTTPGHKWVTVSGTSGTCTITRLAKLTVLGA